MAYSSNLKKYSIISPNFQNTIKQRVWFIVLVCISLIPAILAIINEPLHPDTAFYLSIVERMNEGYLPYKDIKVGYAPFVFYLLLFLKKLLHIGIQYEFYLAVHFIIQFLCSFFVYKITVIFTNKRTLSLYSAILFIIASHWNDGNTLLLETTSLLWGLIGIYLTIKHSNKTFFFLYIGIIAALSFLSKQYGIGFLFLIIYLIIFNKCKWKQLGYLLLGFMLPIFIFYLILGNSLISIIDTRSYDIKKSTSGHIMMIVNSMKYFFIRIFPVLIIGIFYSPIIIKNAEKKAIINISMLVLAILGFSLQFYFAPFSNYFLLIIPFASILSFVILSHILKFKWIYKIFLLFTIGLSFYSTFHNRVYKIYYLHRELKTEQYRLAMSILNNINKNKTFYIADIGLIPQYYLTNLTPPNLKTIGYTFGFALNQKTHLVQIKQANYILKFKKEYDDFNLNSYQVKYILAHRKTIELSKNIVLYY